MSECLQERTYLAVRGATAPELRGHEHREDLAFLQEIVVLGNEGVGLVAQSGGLCEARAELPYERIQIDGVSHGQSPLWRTPESGRRTDQLPRQVRYTSPLRFERLRSLRREAPSRPYPVIIFPHADGERQRLLDCPLLAVSDGRRRTAPFVLPSAT
jgi:hypothetical protein